MWKVKNKVTGVIEKKSICKLCVKKWIRNVLRKNPGFSYELYWDGIFRGRK